MTERNWMKRFYHQKNRSIQNWWARGLRMGITATLIECRKCFKLGIWMTCTCRRMCSFWQIYSRITKLVPESIQQQTNNGLRCDFTGNLRHVIWRMQPLRVDNESIVTCGSVNWACSLYPTKERRVLVVYLYYLQHLYDSLKDIPLASKIQKAIYHAILQEKIRHTL